MKYTLGELAKHVSGEVKGDASCEIESVGTLHHADNTQISFLTNPSYRKQLASSQAGAVIMSAADAELCTINAIISSNCYSKYPGNFIGTIPCTHTRSKILVFNKYFIHRCFFPF